MPYLCIKNPFSGFDSVFIEAETKEDEVLIDKFSFEKQNVPTEQEFKRINELSRIATTKKYGQERADEIFNEWERQRKESNVNNI